MGILARGLQVQWESLLRKVRRSGEVTQRAKAFAATPDDLPLTAGIHTMGGENQLPQFFLGCMLLCTLIYTYKYVQFKTLKK